MISFIIPAHNEEAWIARSVAAIHAAAQPLAEPYEIIVADDSSDDRTAELAFANGAKVVRIESRQISAARNAGARIATGELLFFVDADTLVNAPVVAAAIERMCRDVPGGGCIATFEGKLPLWWRFVYPPIALTFRLVRQTGGACLFCRRDVFDAIGGFSEAHFAAEEAVFGKALKRHGRFYVPPGTVITSGRKLREFSLFAIGGVLLRIALKGPNAFRTREKLEVWYASKREKPVP
jgi:glycosyltransferase involved in cell wall biosynthesis